MLNFSHQDIIKFEQTAEFLRDKIKDGKLIFDGTTANLEYVNLEQFHKRDEDAGKHLDIEIHEVEFRTEQPNLKYLDLGAQNIKRITIRNCPSLKALYLHGCGLEEIRFEGKFPELQLIDVSSNQLTYLDLPPENFPALQYLFFEKNQIKDLSFLSPFILDEDREFDFGYEKNPIETPPAETVKLGAYEIVNWFRQQKKYGKAYFYEAKIILIGDGWAGKTTVRKLLNNRNYKVPNEEDSTLGFEISLKKFPHPYKKDVEINAHIWDFGGQETQYSLHNFFITSDALYILVYDYRKGGESNISYWLKTVKLLSGEGTTVLILGNKRQDVTSTNFDFKGLKKDFSDLNLEYFVLDLSKINEEYKQEWDKFYQSLVYNLTKLNTVGQEGIKVWNRVLGWLADQKEKNRHYVSYEEMWRFASDKKDKTVKAFETEDDFLFMLEYFHKTGQILHYGDISELANYIFIDPQWISNAIYYAFKEREGIETSQKAFITKKWIYDYWGQKNYRNTDKNLLLSLMQKDRFDVCYPIENKKDVYAVPSLMSDEPAYHWNEENNLRLRIKFPSIIPKGILPRFIVRMYENIYSENGQQIVWKDGVKLQYEKTTFALVRQRKDEPIIEIKVYGEQANVFRYQIIRELGKLFSVFQTKPQLQVPCICDECRTSTEPYYFDWQDLVKAKNKAKAGAEPEIQCRKSFEMVPVKVLLDDYKQVFETYASGEEIEIKEPPLNYNQFVSNLIKNTSIEIVPERPRKYKNFEVKIAVNPIEKSEFKEFEKFLGKQVEVKLSFDKDYFEWTGETQKSFVFDNEKQEISFLLKAKNSGEASLELTLKSSATANKTKQVNVKANIFKDVWMWFESAFLDALKKKVVKIFLLILGLLLICFLIKIKVLETQESLCKYLINTIPKKLF